MEDNKEKNVEIKENKKNEKVEENEKIKNDKRGKITLWLVIILIFLGIVEIIVLASIKDKCNDCENPRVTPRELHTNSNTNSNTKSEPSEDWLHVDIYKPIIYLYPAKETQLTVKLGYPKKLTCSYPKYENEWKIIAKPDGTLTDVKTGRSLYSLYWEGKGSAKTNMDEGFVIKGEDSAIFLEEKLSILGLTEREAEEFIVYWLPKLESNKYNYIRFATMEEINEYMPLEFSVKPDSLIRVLMQFKGLESPIEVKEQELKAPKRGGFVAVEWGGTELK